jgi:hypothetical protein
MKKLLIIAALLLLPVTIYAAVSVAGYVDQEEFPEWAKQSINQVTSHGLMKGYEDDTFRSENPVSRAELAVILERLETGNSWNMQKYAGMISELENANTDLKPEVKQVIALAAGGFNRQTARPSCVYVNKAGEMPKTLGTYYGYTVYECRDLFVKFAVNYKFTGVVAESDGEIAVIDEWFGPYDLHTGYLALH